MSERSEVTTRTIPCAACGGQLEFAIGIQQLQCPHCGTAQEIATPPGAVAHERDLRAAVAELRARADDAGPQLEGEQEVVCQSCGGHTTFTGTLTSTRCPYCATPIQRDDVHDAPTRLPVDGVVPFRVAEPDARAAVEQWINGRRFAPKEFKKYNQTGSFSSIYASFFTFDTEARTRYDGERGERYTVTVGSGDDKRTETRTRWHHASGEVTNTFDDVCVLANEGFDPKRIDALGPWPTGDAVPFAPEYVAGHLSRTYDRDVEACFADARERMEEEIDETVRDHIGGDEQRVHEQDTTWSPVGFKHLLLPIWLLTVVYAGEPFQVLINGTTGEVHGQRPWSKAKLAMAIAAALVVVLIVLVLVAG